jgi:hypothetical protein
MRAAQKWNAVVPFDTRGAVREPPPWSLDIFSIQDKRVPITVGIIIGVGVGIGIGIEGQKMGFGHEKPGAGNATRKALLDRIVAMLTKLG